MYKSTQLNVVAFALLIAGLVFIGIGFDKKNNYVNSEYSFVDNVNVYVGGDAYNYIINANYFTGYIVLGAASCLASVVVFATSALITSKNNQRRDNLSEGVKECIKEEKKYEEVQEIIVEDAECNNKEHEIY